MPDPNEQTRDYLAAARDLQARQVEYLQRGDVQGLVNALYTEDARFDSFDVHAAGRDAVAGVIGLYLRRTAGLGRRTIETFTAGRDYIWFELAMEGPEAPLKAPDERQVPLKAPDERPAGPVRTYEVKFLREGRIALELFGAKEGVLWEPEDFAGARLPDTAAAMALHDTYVGYHARGDADGLADDMFTEDARLVTPRLAVEGREQVRSVFRDIFARESGFEPGSVDRITCGDDYIWFEATVSSSLGHRRLYDVMLLSDGKISLQLVGSLEGAIPTDVVGTGERVAARSGSGEGAGT
ncbi:MAG TPA: nuclear transport factor 2 family protein [Actinomycetota bacterium]